MHKFLDKADITLCICFYYAFILSNKSIWTCRKCCIIITFNSKIHSRFHEAHSTEKFRPLCSSMTLCRRIAIVYSFVHPLSMQNILYFKILQIVIFNIIYVNSLHYYIVTYLRLNKAIFDFLLAPLKFCADCSFKFTAFIVSAE